MFLLIDTKDWWFCLFVLFRTYYTHGNRWFSNLQMMCIPDYEFLITDLLFLLKFYKHAFLISELLVFSQQCYTWAMSISKR